MHGGHSYLVVEQGRTWLNAAVDATSRQRFGASGYLAVVNEAAENAAIFAQLSNTANIPTAEYANTRAPDGGNGIFVWIAATDRIIEGAWIWDDDGDGVGTQFWQGTGAAGSIVGGLYHNWGRDPANPALQREPDNGAGGLQDAAGIGILNWPRGRAGEWNDIRADNSLYYVVEFNAVPEASSIVLIAIAAAAMLRRRQTAGLAP
jgi:hypothetical protein